MELYTEGNSPYEDLEKMDTLSLLVHMNEEDQKVPAAVAKVIPEIERLVNALVPKIREGGRLFYLGAGTSGRLGILDAAECPPTFGVEEDIVIGMIAGGDQAIRKAVEQAEDDDKLAWKMLSEFQINTRDTVVGIAASGRTPFVIGGLRDCRKHGIQTACITCNPSTLLASFADYPIEAIVGPEFLTGSTRMKAGTATKLVLNMISTSMMIKLGHVRGNLMIDMKLHNSKLLERGVRIILQETHYNRKEAKSLLKKLGSVRAVLDHADRK